MFASNIEITESKNLRTADLDELHQAIYP